MAQENSPKVDKKEFEIPQTTYSRDIESRVIQMIILQCLGKIKGVGVIGGTLIDTLFGREIEKVKGIYVDQDPKTHSVKVKVEINIEYGIAIPQKTEEVQIKIVEEITTLTGLHVASIHVIVKGLLSSKDKPIKEDPIALLIEDGNAEDERLSPN